MKAIYATMLICLFALMIQCKSNQSNTTTSKTYMTQDTGWVELFNGKDLSGWTASENASTWTVTDGVMQAYGKRSHLYYSGEYLRDSFKNFDLIATIRTHHLANSGVYYHTTYQQEGWPNKGIEAQVNNSHVGEGNYVEFKKGGSLYSYRNIYRRFIPDSTWYEMHIKVEDRHVQIWINGQQTVDFIAPKDGKGMEHDMVRGTIALQGHDTLSKTQFKSVKIRRLSEDLVTNQDSHSYGPWYDSLKVYNGKQYISLDLDPSGDLNESEVLKSTFESGVNGAVVKDLSHINELSTIKSPIVFRGVRISAQQIKSIKKESLAFADYVIGKCKSLAEAIELIQSGWINVLSINGESINVKNANALLDLAKKTM